MVKKLKYVYIISIICLLMNNVSVNLPKDFKLDDFSTIAIYTRVSTGAQAYSGKNGLSIQLTTCKMYCNKVLNTQRFSHYEDIGTSYRGKSILANQNRMIKQLQENSIILMYSVSRMGRDLEQSVKFLTSLKRKGIKVIAVTDNSCYGKTRLLDKQFYYRMIHAEEKSDLKAEKMRVRNNLIISMGGYVGGIPYGYDINKMNGIPMLTKNNREQKIITNIKTLLKKHQTKTDIAIYLNNKGFDKRGRLWTARNISTVNLNRSYRTYRLKDNGDLPGSFNNLRI